MFFRRDLIPYDGLGRQGAGGGHVFKHIYHAVGVGPDVVPFHEEGDHIALDFGELGNDIGGIGIADKDQKAMEQAIFWIGQSKSDETLDVLADVYAKTDSKKVKEQIIYAFSQNKSKKAIRGLINMAKKEKDLELKKSIIFWLGQSKDEEAIKYLTEILK